MTTWLEPTLVLALAFLLGRPLGAYLGKVLEGKPPRVLPLQWLERAMYRVGGVDPFVEMTGREYAMALLRFHLVGLLCVFLVQELQQWLPLNPQRFGAVRWDVALNTAVSFVTNTDWQAYAGEQTMSHFTQMLALTVQNFLSAAAGLAVLAVLARGFTRRECPTLGNFWADLVRATVYVLLPLSLIWSVLLVSQGVPQTFSGQLQVTTLEGTRQTIAIGPVASQEAIKQVGSNGGGFFNANSAHPFENPTPLSNFLETLAILLLPVACPFAFGHLLGDRKQGWAPFWAMAGLFLVGLLVVLGAEWSTVPQFERLGIVGGNVEGKEVRFGLIPSALWAQATTAVSLGAVNSAHESLMPLASLVLMFNMGVGEPIFGGAGAGVLTMMFYVLLTMFLAGLMIGRTPEYFGKKLGPYEMAMTIVGVVVPVVALLALASLAIGTPQGRMGVSGEGAHGISQVLYAFASTTGNNGSALAGLRADLSFYTLATSFAMLAGRFATLLPAIAIASSLARKRAMAATAATFPTSNVFFIALLMAVVVLEGALTLFPAFVLGPFLEHLQLVSGR
jgi:K+-transporting ATPase ATPase A chain